MKERGLGADNGNVAMKSGGRVAVQFYRGGLPILQKPSIDVIDGYVDDRPGSIHDLREGITLGELASRKILDVRRSNGSVTWRTQLGLVEERAGAIHFCLPKIGLHAMHARFRAIIRGESAVHLQQSGFELGLRLGQRRPKIPGLKLGKDLPFLHGLAFADKHLADDSFNLGLDERALPRANDRITINAQRQRAGNQKKQCSSSKSD